MGILSRIRQRSSSIHHDTSSRVSSSPAPHSPSASNLLSTPQTPGTPGTSYNPSSPAAASISSKKSRRPWKKREESEDVIGTKSSWGRKSVGKDLEKEKETEKGGDESIGGDSQYADFTPPPVPALSLPALGSKEGYQSSPLLNKTPSSTGDQEKGKSRTNSGVFKQDGGLLGKLNFERGDRERKVSNSSFILKVEPELKPSPPRRSSVPGTPSEEGESLVVIDSRDLSPEKDEKTPESKHPLSTSVMTHDSQQEEDPMEVLESAEKKHKFWKSKGKVNRHSRVMSESQIERPESPSPVKLPTSSTADNLSSQARRSSESTRPARPPPLRRPSSSFLANPFNRSVSRAGKRSPATDEGTFQLRGFRHVSGMSDVESAGKLEGYLSHAKRESVLALVKSTTSVDDSIPSHSPSAYSAPRHSSYVPLTRPPSAAPSLVSLDDVLTSSNRVSVGAFRKGLRRPSAQLTSTMSDVGHGASRYDEDDDDVPLAMRQVSQPVIRPKSSQSLSSMRGLGLTNVGGIAVPNEIETVAQVAPEPGHQEVSGREIDRTESPALSFQVRPRTRNRTSSGFVVKGRSPKSPPESLAKSPADSYFPSMANASDSLRASPVQTRVSSPANGESKSVTPLPRSPAEASEEVYSTPPTAARPVSLHFLKPKPDFGEHAFPSPLDTARQPSQYLSRSQESQSALRSPPPPEPLGLPEPGQVSPTLSTLNLPLPPDQMPDTPPKGPVPLHQLSLRQDSGGPQATSPGTPKKRLSLLEEPMRYLSGLWTSPGAGEDGFDPVLAANSLRIFGGDEVQSPTTADDKDMAFVDRQASPTPVSAPAPIAERVRCPLSERLAGVAALSASGSSGNLAKPEFEKLKTGDDMLQPQRDMDDAKSPASDDTATPVYRPSPRPFSSFMKPSTSKRGENEESGSETEGERPGPSVQESRRVQSLSLRQSTRRAPGGPRHPNRSSRIASMPITTSQMARKESIARNIHIGDSDDDDKPLYTVKRRMPRSSLAAGKSPVYGQSDLPTPPTSIANASLKSASPPERRRPLIDMAPVVPITPRSIGESSVESASISNRPPDRSQTSTPASGQLPSPVKAQVRFDSPAKRPANPRRTTGGSDKGSRKGESGVRRSNSREALQNGQERDRRERRRSETGSRHPSPYDPPVQAQMGTQPMPDMQQTSQEAYLAWQKHQWQMQYLAAAYRASEDEWERQSAVSGSTNQGPSSQFSPYSMPPMPMFNPNMNMMNTGMPMGYPGFPQMPQQMPPQMFNPFFGMGQPQHMQQGNGGGYAYGKGAQSVFGGEFGPPSNMPSQQRQMNEAIRTSSIDQNISPPRKSHNDQRAKTRSTSALGVRRPSATEPSPLKDRLAQHPSGVFLGLLAEREKVELREQMERSAHENLEKQRRVSKEGKSSEPRRNTQSRVSPPSSWSRRSGEWSSGEHGASSRPNGGRASMAA
ncbi:hypothetical protein L198_05482 [Cryptococcus wingfieldii CBS 7118]|uniref:Glucoamylase n=1 Tax=Cryptococcus wingfieldii CBS 7118 TaxID=1295528 RepID=A0A1E3IVV9_9TREE|nr:hypothetical protein L198_05482 [Cryptococcus wingfieldii CBS 7118]ODN92688.1 hypothetical protein L198_05482 [Cryptococcus wingfieldii CBS 7118]